MPLPPYTQPDDGGDGSQDPPRHPYIEVHEPALSISLATTTPITVSGVADGTVTAMEGATFSALNGTWATSVALHPGLNTIQVNATDANGHETSRTIMVVYKPPQ